MRLVKLLLSLICTSFFLATATAQEPAAAIYHGGDVVTIDDKNPTAHGAG